MCIMVPMGRVQVICNFRNYNYWTGNAIGFRAFRELFSNFLSILCKWLASTWPTRRGRLCLFVVKVSCTRTGFFCLANCIKVFEVRIAHKNGHAWIRITESCARNYFHKFILTQVYCKVFSVIVCHQHKHCDLPACLRYQMLLLLLMTVNLRPLLTKLQ